MSQDRQPKGTPIGGRYAAAVRAEPVVTLATPAPGSETAVHDAVRDRGEKMRGLKRELELIHLQGAVDSLRRAFPDAAELRADHARDHRGYLSKGLEAVRLLDVDGNDATGGDDQWFYRGSPEHGMSPAYHLSECQDIHLNQDLIGEDPETSEYVIRLDHSYWTDGDS